jgi:hypothetical protein
MPEPLSPLVSTVVKNNGTTDIISLNYDGKHTVRLAAGESLRILGDPLSGVYGEETARQFGRLLENGQLIITSSPVIVLADTATGESYILTVANGVLTPVPVIPPAIVEPPV